MRWVSDTAADSWKSVRLTARNQLQVELLISIPKLACIVRPTKPRMKYVDIRRIQTVPRVLAWLHTTSYSRRCSRTCYRNRQRCCEIRRAGTARGHGNAIYGYCIAECSFIGRTASREFQNVLPALSGQL